MKKQLINKLLAGAVILAPLGAFVSCNDDDIDSLDERVTVLEGMIRDLEDQINDAIVTGSTITSASQDASGVWTLILSDGSSITISPSSGGGSSVSVEETDDAFIITINGTAYTLTKGASVSSLVFVDEYGDRTVLLDSDGASVPLLCTPSLSDISSATFSIADARELQTRAGEDLFDVTGAELDGDLIRVALAGSSCEAGVTYIVAVQMSVSGTTISSDYFKVQVADDFSFDAEALEDPVMNTSLITDFEAKGDDAWTATIPDPLGEFSFADFYAEIPSGTVEFSLAPKAAQNSEVQNAYDIFSAALSSDGSWKLTTRPGTSGYDEENNGILIYMKVDRQIKNKIWWKIDDPLRDLDFQSLGGIPSAFEAELYGRSGEYVPIGASTLDIPYILNNYETYIPIIHGGEDCFTSFIDFNIETDDKETLIYNDGSTLVVGDYAKNYTQLSRGILWYIRGVSIIVPETLATSDGKYVDASGKEWSGAENYGYDTWGSSNVADYINNSSTWYGSNGNDTYKWSELPFSMDESTGKLSFTSDYTGYGFRFAFVIAFEYDYGYKSLISSSAEQLGLLFINRRVSDESATMPY